MKAICKAGGLLSLLLWGLLAQAEAVPEGGPLTQGLGYDANGNLTTVNLPKGVGALDARQQSHDYDGLGRRIKSTLAAPQPGASAPVMGLGYDGLDQIKSVTDPRNLSTTYGTHGLGNMSPQISPDSGSTGFTYNPDGSLDTRTDARGKEFHYFYDDIGRLTRISYTSGKDSQFEYDGGVSTVNNSTGQLSKLTDESGNTNYTHDGLGRVLSKTQLVKTGTNPIISRSLVLGQSWGDSGSALGKLATQTYPSQARISYEYSATTGQLQAIRLNPVKADGSGTNTAQTVDLLTGIGYTALGQPESWLWGSGVAYSRGFDEHSRLKSYPLGDPLGALKTAGTVRTLEYDDAGRIRRYTHINGRAVPKPEFNQSFGYDGLDRVTTQDLPTSSYGYEYDLSNNRTSQNLGGSSYLNTVANNSNRLMKERGPAGTTSFSYDDAGNLKSDGTNTFTYSDRGRLSKVVTPTGTVNYLYNAIEQRVVKTGASGPLGYYVYDEQGHLIGEYDANGDPVQETVYFGDTPVAVITQTRSGSGASLNVVTNISYIYADHLDTPRLIARASDHAVIWRWDQAEAYGNSPPNDSPTNLGSFTYNPRFPGQLFDKDSSLLYNLHRDYRAQSGRYTQSDPIGLNGGINTYAYAEGSPTRETDPLGLATYMCTQPLHALGKAGHAVYAPSYNPLYHQFIGIVREDGTVITGGQDRAAGPWGPGKPSSGDGAPGAGAQCTKVEDDNECLEQCLMNEFGKPRPKYALAISGLTNGGQNCQAWAKNTLEQCQNSCKSKQLQQTPVYHRTPMGF